MNCLKCGREIPLGQVFCKECLVKMEQYPIKQGTPLNLPNRTTGTAPRRTSHSRKIRKPEEQIARLRRLVLLQTLALLVVLAAFIITLVMIGQKTGELDIQLLPGQNYSTIETTHSSPE